MRLIKISLVLYSILFAMIFGNRMAGSVFFVTALKLASKVGERLNELIPEEDRYEIANDKWMVSYEGPARELAEKVGIRGGDDGFTTGLVLPVTTYSGRAPTDLWEWLRKKGT